MPLQIGSKLVSYLDVISFAFYKKFVIVRNLS